MSPPSALIVDLNNFARYPTLAVGYLTSILRRAGCDVRVLSPLAVGARGITRERPERRWSLIEERLRYWTAVCAPSSVRLIRSALARAQTARHAAAAARIADSVRAALAEQPGVVLISTYLMYRPVCELIGRLCQEARSPLIIGGPYFAQPEVADAWLDIPGLTALIVGEVEPRLTDLVADAAAGRPLDSYPGVRTPGSSPGEPCPPLKDLDAVPFPDLTDFPWTKYPNQIIPLITGRGCAWGACTFCSDVTSTIGRTFRTRSPSGVLDEVEAQCRRHKSDLLVFTDLKLNSSLPMWRGLLDGLQRRRPGVRWIGSVHVGARADNGLSEDELRAARAAGMVRLTTGLESGSQRILDSMAKGTDLALTSRTLRAAAAAGISVRTTMIVGWPGEGPEDVHASARFLRDHAGVIQRVRLNRLAIPIGTVLHRRLERRPDAFPGLVVLTVDRRAATTEHRYTPARHPAFRRAVTQLLTAVHEINRRPLPASAADFEGVM